MSVGIHASIFLAGPRRDPPGPAGSLFDVLSEFLCCGRGCARSQDGTGAIDVDGLEALRSSAEFRELQGADLDMQLEGSVSLADWLLAAKANGAKSEEGTRRMLAMYDAHLRRRGRGKGGPK